MAKKNLKLTRRGKEYLENKIANLEKELDSLNEEIRVTISILGTRDSQYHLLNRKKSDVLFEIEQTESIIDCSQIMPKGVVGATVEIGNRVKLQNHKYCYDVRIVSTIEADPIKQMVSDESPIGLSVIGKKLGETVIIKTPGAGEVDFLIKEIS